MSKIRTKVHNESQERYEYQKAEIIALSRLFIKAAKESFITKEIILKAIEADLYIIEEIKTRFIESDPFPLRYNKLSYLLKGAHIFFSKNYNELLSDEFDIDVLFEFPVPQGISDPQFKSSTSLQNFAQTAFLEGLSVIRGGVNIDQIPDIKQESIYDIDYSPNIQAVKSASEAFSGFENFRWISCAHGSVELIVPALGYYFGGSRYDTNYTQKYFRQEDCSSSVAKWTDSQVPFTTYDIKNFAPSVREVMTPLKDDREPQAGDILCFGGHVCVVSNFVDNQSPIEVMSYNRLMPFFEGLIHQSYAQMENGAKIVSLDYNLLAKCKVEDYYGLDSSLQYDENNQPKVNISGGLMYFEYND